MSEVPKFVDVHLDHEDLISLVKGTGPNYSVMKEFGHLGQYSDPIGWRWDSAKLDRLTDEQLFEVYLRCKLSWKK